MITATDLFCGAGGSATGAENAGIHVVMAANHWEKAIETHALNHPNTEHDCADISQIEPRRYPATDILWGSPECTNHSIAKGVSRKRQTERLQATLWDEGADDDAAIRSRATMWDIPRFAEYHEYPIVITENVVDAAKWGMFPAWLQAMHLLGYEHHIVWLNSMHAGAYGDPAPQSRDRMYVVFWKGIKAPDFDRLRPGAVCAEHGPVRAVQVFKKPMPWGRYRAQYVYRCPKCGLDVEPPWIPAATVIDWTNPGTRIGDRPRPLAAKTMRRIQAGIDRYWHAGPTGLVTDGIHGTGTVHPINEPLKTQTTAQTKGLLVPVEGRDGKHATPVEKTLRTQTTRNETGLAYPPLVTNHFSGSDQSKSVVADEAALPTIMSSGVRQSVLNPPLIINHLSGSDASRSALEHESPLRTLAAGGNHESILRHEPLLVPYYGNGQADTVSEPHRTLTTTDRYALAQSETVDINDCYFRMLTPDEVKQGMAFPAHYEAVGNGREQVRMWGNAVTPPAARDLYQIAAEALGETE